MSETVEKPDITEQLRQVKAFVKKGKFKQALVCCEEILSLQPDNSKIRQLVGELKRKQRLLEKEQSKGDKIEALRCPNCSKPVQIFSQESDSVSCRACGSLISLAESEPEVAADLGRRMCKPLSFIQLGKICEFDGKKFQVIGRIRFLSRCREWDPEDGQYYTEPWEFDEWILVGESKEYRYLSEDSEGYALSKSFTPTAPKIPEVGEEYLSLDKDIPPQRIDEFNNSKIVFLEGEFTWVPSLGERVKSAEYRVGINTYSVEWRLAEDGKQIKEVEFFVDEPKTMLDLAHAFGEEEIVAEEERKAQYANECKRWSWLFFACAVVCFLMMIATFGKSGRRVYSETVTYAQIPEHGLVSRPFELKRKGSVHRLTLSTSLPRANTYAWGAVELLDENQISINAVDGDFWWETGYDDGHWEEKDISRKRHFLLKNPGKYHLRYFVEENPQSGTLTVNIDNGVILSRWFFMGFVFCLGLGTSLRFYKRVNPLFIILGLFAIGFYILSNVEWESD